MAHYLIQRCSYFPVPDTEVERRLRARGGSRSALSKASRMLGGVKLAALRPMLSTTNGAIWLLSTPCEKRGFFYEAWEHGGEMWERIRVTAPECGRIPAEFLEEERNSLGLAWFRQEYMAEFMDIGGGFFGRDIVEAALVDDLEAVSLDMKG